MKTHFNFVNTWQAVLSIALLLLATAISSGQDRIDAPLELTGRTMGPIPYSVVVAHYPKSVTSEALQSAVVDSLQRVNRLMSTYIAESDVSRFNDSNSTEFFEVDPETAKVVARSIEISQQTEGAFDITVGPAVNLWNFGPNKKQRFEIPSDEEIAAVKQVIGYEQLSVQFEPAAIRKSQPGVKIDLSAIAKGYAVDQVLAELAVLGCRQVMVEVGGEIRTMGERYAGGPWRIAVEKPSETKSSSSDGWSGVAVISDRALATSGDYRNYAEFEGHRYSHTINPATCRPVTHWLATASIIADDCMTADALATAVSVLGFEAGAEMCEKLGVDYYLVNRDSELGTSFVDKSSTGFPFQEPVKKKVASNSIWPTFLGAIVIFGLMIVFMAVGAIFANKPITGSCGGIANVTNEDGESNCGICSKPTTDCVENQPTANA
ncbi:MAG: thiamine biosynthesis lipoprotein [Mariniblastus sp.]|jgi:thiamine biosynthesis lipoprotein